MTADRLAEILQELRAIPNIHSDDCPAGYTASQNEDGHVRADALLCEALRLLGQGEIADAHAANGGFWYA